MRMTEAVRTCLRKYFRFSGRASRPEYWYFVLFCVLLGMVASFADAALFPPSTGSEEGPLASLVSLATFVPLLAAGWRRMHDTGRSGLYLLYPLIAIFGIASFLAFTVEIDPVLGGDLGVLFQDTVSIVLFCALLVAFVSPLIVLWWLTRPSQPGPNTYGDAPG
ncbi:MAG: DUF805 domain-containing protein [Rhodobacteraceae bacterium]|nr:DUF805 domain-containing protein [Paracoccaceae bacterium]